MHLRRWRLASLVLVVGLTAAACSDSSPGATPPSSGPSSTLVSTDTTGAGSTHLGTGKSDLVLTPGTYTSPDGFQPALRITVTGSGWRSTHRGSDGFDLSRPDPATDAPLVALVVVTPPEADAAAALATLTSRASAAGARTSISSTTIGGLQASVVDVRDGQGPLVMSARNGIALDAGTGQRLRVFVLDIGGAPVVAAIFVPDQARWADGREAALPLLSSITAS